MNPRLDHIASLALSHSQTVYSSYDHARMAVERNIPGDFVECGVFAGAQCAAMALALVETATVGRRVHLFDSFSGIPEPGPEDFELRESNSLPGSACCTLEAVQGYMKLWEIPDDLLVFHPGWFADTIPAAELGALALLRLDGDLYESTRVCMAYLWPKLSFGGWCIVDDYNLSGCRKAVSEVVFPQPCYFQKL